MENKFIKLSVALSGRFYSFQCKWKYNPENKVLFDNLIF